MNHSLHPLDDPKFRGKYVPRNCDHTSECDIVGEFHCADDKWRCLQHMADYQASGGRLMSDTPPQQ